MSEFPCIEGGERHKRRERRERKRERREDEHEWQAGFGGMQNSFTQCPGVVCVWRGVTEEVVVVVTETKPDSKVRGEDKPITPPESQLRDGAVNCQISNMLVLHVYRGRCQG